jgi:hypothetical protein
MSNLFDWDALGLGPEEDPSIVKDRLDKIHGEILKAKGIDTVPGKNSPGFNPTTAQAREVSVMACLGLDSKDIALVLNIEHKMLKLYYGKELSVSLNIANAMVARQALQMALSGRNPDMTKFWLKAKANWRETQGVDITSNGKTLEGATAKDKLRDTLAAAGAVNKKAEQVREPDASED